MRHIPGLATLSMGAMLALIATAPVSAQTRDSQQVTDIVIPDTPRAFVRDQVLTNALNDSQRDDILAGSELLKNTLQGAVIAAFGTTAQGIIDSFDLDAIGSLQFTTIGNKAGVEQDGQRNIVRIDQSRGNAGWVIANQAGENNAAIIDQADTRAAGQRSLNRVYVGQVGGAVASSGQLYSNYARIQQTHRSLDLTAAAFNGNNLVNTATIQQGGFRDLAFARFDAVANRNDALIEQEGAENDGVIQQGVESPNTFRFEQGDAVGRNNRAILRQVGYGNHGVILQEDDANAITHQYGSDNLAYVRQDGDVLDGGQYSLIEQGKLESGDVNSNFASVFQRGMLQESTIKQHSNRNDAYVYQTAEAAYAKSIIDQSGGIGNYASVFQFAPGASVADGVFSAILQNGSLNEAFVSQGIPSSYSVVQQQGNNNFARVRQ